MAYLTQFQQPLTGQRRSADAVPTALRGADRTWALGGITNEQSARYLQTLQQPVPPGVDLSPGFPYGPYTPLQPLGTEQEFALGPRRLEYPIGANIQYIPRTTESISFEELRNFAEIYNIARICIERRKHMLVSLDWQIVSRIKGEEKSNLPDIRTAEKFFDKPDGERTWDKWVGMYMEDVLGIDAPAIHLRRSRKGDLQALVLIDGATLHPVIDDAGAVYGYQQVIYGMPRTVYINPYYLPLVEGAAGAQHFPLDQIIYRPRVPTTYRLYGFPPGEQIILTINTMLRKQIQDLQHWVSGNMPEALAPMPEGTSLQAALQFQEDYNSLLEGNPSLRAQLRFLPGGIDPSKIKEVRPFSSETNWDELMITITCAAYLISPQDIGITQKVNRATAEMQENISYRVALVPDLTDIESLCDDILGSELHLPHLQMKINYGEDEDILKRAQADKIYFSMGASTVDRIVADRALGDPLGVDEPYVIVPGVGIVWLNDAMRQRDAARQPGGDHDGASASGNGGVASATTSNNRAVPPPNPSGAEDGVGREQRDAGARGAVADRSGATTAEDSGATGAQGGEAQKVALAQWKDNSLARLKHGKRPKLTFTSDDISADMQKTIAARLGKATTPQEIKAAFNSDRIVLEQGTGGRQTWLTSQVAAVAVPGQPLQRHGYLRLANKATEQKVRAALEATPPDQRHWQLENVPVDHLWTFQLEVGLAEKEQLATLPLKELLKDNLYEGYALENRYYLTKGNHHAEAALMNGATELPINILKLEAPAGETAALPFPTL